MRPLGRHKVAVLREVALRVGQREAAQHPPPRAHKLHKAVALQAHRRKRGCKLVVRGPHIRPGHRHVHAGDQLVAAGRGREAGGCALRRFSSRQQTLQELASLLGRPVAQRPAQQHLCVSVQPYRRVCTRGSRLSSRARQAHPKSMQSSPQSACSAAGLSSTRFQWRHT